MQVANNLPKMWLHYISNRDKKYCVCLVKEKAKHWRITNGYTMVPERVLLPELFLKEKLTSEKENLNRNTRSSLVPV